MITRRETLTGAAALAIAGSSPLPAQNLLPYVPPTAGATQRVAVTSANVPPDSLPLIQTRSQLLTSLAIVMPVLKDFADKPLVQLIKERMLTVDLGHLHYPPTAVEELVGDVSGLTDQLLSLRRELIGLETLAYQTAADITNNKQQNASDSALISLSSEASLAAQRDGYDNAVLKVGASADALAQAFAAQAAGLGGSTKAQIAQISPAIKAQNDKVNARNTYWDNLRTITTNSDSDLAYSQRRDRLVQIFLDCMEELYQKVFSLQVGITQILVKDNASELDPDFKKVNEQFPDYNNADVVEKLVLWARAAGRFIERRSFERITTTAVVPLLMIGMWGNTIISDKTDWNKDGPFDAHFTIEPDKDLPSDGDPRIVGIGVQLGQEAISNHDRSPSQTQVDETVRSSVNLVLPKTSLKGSSRCPRLIKI